MSETRRTLLHMQHDRLSDAGGLEPSADRLTPGERTELEEIELLAELMILANRAPVKAASDEIDEALGLVDHLERRNAS